MADKAKNVNKYSEFFKYDEETGRDWIEINLYRDPPLNVATIQDYARWANRSPERWVQDALVWFMHECDRQGAHGNPAPMRKPIQRKKIPAWKIRLSETLIGWSMKLDGSEDDDDQCY